MSPEDRERELAWDREGVAVRREIRTQMRRLLACKTKAQKVRLWQDWQSRFPKDQVDELVRFAQDKKAAVKISEWRLPGDGRDNRKVRRVVEVKVDPYG